MQCRLEWHLALNLRTDHLDAYVRRGDCRAPVGFTPETLAFQLFYHEVHHRAQVMAMLRLLGVAAQDLDFNKYAFEWTELAPAEGTGPSRRLHRTIPWGFATEQLPLVCLWRRGWGVSEGVRNESSET
jgi:hypothetical protein